MDLLNLFLKQDQPLTIKMKLVLLLICLLGIAVCDNWAILVAGSHTYSNYRHQADVYHAYQILKKNGFAQDKIITFAYDDIAHNIKNPIKGKVFNRPTYAEPGVDVYQGIVIDYKGIHVEPAVFLHVLEGNKSAVSGIGTGKVLQSTKDDNVFIYFADHGAPGLIAFPFSNLYADHLLASLSKINGKYNKLVFYVEACESGSMFTKLPNNTKIYALSAANPSESSWGTYCSPQDIVQGKHIGSCLGDLFSVNFLEDSEQNDIFSQTLEEQYQIIKRKTNQSHVLQWGDMSFKGDKVSEYIANQKGLSFKYGIPIINQLRKEDKQSMERVNMNSRISEILTWIEITKENTSKQNMDEFIRVVKENQYYDNIFMRLDDEFSSQLSSQKYDAYNINFDCLRSVIDYFQAKNGRTSDYGFYYMKYFARACEIASPEQIISKLGVSMAAHSKP